MRCIEQAKRRHRQPPRGGTGAVFGKSVHPPRTKRLQENIGHPERQNGQPSSGYRILRLQLFPLQLRRTFGQLTTRKRSTFSPVNPVSFPSSPLLLPFFPYIHTHNPPIPIYLAYSIYLALAAYRSVNLLAHYLASRLASSFLLLN